MKYTLFLVGLTMESILFDPRYKSSMKQKPQKPELNNGEKYVFNSYTEINCFQSRKKGN
jgi:hypothetical protein